MQAVEPVELLEIRRELIDELVAAHPGVARTLRTFYRERLLQTLLATAPFFGGRARKSVLPLPNAFGRGASGAARRSSRRARPAAGSTSSSSVKSTSCARPRTDWSSSSARSARILLRRDVAFARRRRVGDGQGDAHDRGGAAAAARLLRIRRRSTRSCGSSCVPRPSGARWRTWPSSPARRARATTSTSSDAWTRG